MCLNVFAEVMQKKGGRDWFKASKAAAKVGSTSNAPAPSESASGNINRLGPSLFICVEDSPPSPEHILTRKRKVDRPEGAPVVSQKGRKTVTEVAEPVVERTLPLGMWDPSFNLRHKIEFNFDAAEEKVMSEMSEQQMAEFLIDTALRGSAAAYKMVYASNRGDVRKEVERLKKQLEEAVAAHAGCAEKAVEAAKVIADG